MDFLALASRYGSTYSTYGSYSSSSSSAAETAGMAAILGSLGIMWLFILVFVVLTIVAMWKIFTKAGEAGWKSIIPIYNYIVLLQIVGLHPALVLLCLVPFGAFVLSILIAVKLAKAFGKGTGFIIGLILVAPIFYLMLGFGKAEYDPSVRQTPSQPQGPQGPEQPMQ